MKSTQVKWNLCLNIVIVMYSYYCYKLTMYWVTIATTFTEKEMLHIVTYIHADIEDKNYRDLICWMSVVYPYFQLGNCIGLY